MRLNVDSLKELQEKVDVCPGNIYPGKGGGKPSTDYWLVVSTTENACYLIGFDKEGKPCSTASYNKSAMRTRPLIGFCSLVGLELKLTRR